MKLSISQFSMIIIYEVFTLLVLAPFAHGRYSLLVIFSQCSYYLTAWDRLMLTCTEKYGNIQGRTFL